MTTSYEGVNLGFEDYGAFGLSTEPKEDATPQNDGGLHTEDGHGTAEQEPEAPVSPSSEPGTVPPAPDATPPEENGEDVEEKRKRAETHRQTIDIIEETFKRLDDGELTPQQVKEWLERYPQLGDVANRAKRVKDRYRSFVKDAEFLDAQAPAAVKQPEKAQDPDTAPLTKGDLKTFFEEQEMSRQARTINRQREDQFERFALKYDLKDETADKVRQTADALYKINDTWNYEDALRASHRVVLGDKPAPVGAPTGGAGTPATPAAAAPANLSTWSQAASEEDFIRR